MAAQSVGVIVTLGLSNEVLEKLSDLRKQVLSEAVDAVASALDPNEGVAQSLKAGTESYLKELTENDTVDAFAWEKKVLDHYNSQPRPEGFFLGLAVGYGIGMTVAYILK